MPTIVPSLDDPPDLVKIVEAVLGKGGLLSRALPHYEWRPQQTDLARAVAGALSGGRHLLAEAATGTGKTLAYLIPAIFSRRKVIISTGTKTLQDQLIEKDIPDLRRLLPIPFRAVSLKGKSNYLCLYRYRRFCEQPSFSTPEEAGRFESVRAWAEATPSGERSQLPGLPEGSPLWQELSVQGESCLGLECPDYEDCHWVRARRNSAESDLLIVNHHLFFADLMLREQSFGRVLPHYDAIIFDEAHQLEDVATGFFGSSVSSFRIRDLSRDALRELRYAPMEGGALRPVLEGLRVESERFFSGFKSGPERYRLRPREDLSALRPLAEALANALFVLRQQISSVEIRREGLQRLAERAQSIEEDLSVFFDAVPPESVLWCDVREKGVVLSANPLRVDEILKARLFSDGPPVILTSATLSTGGGFSYIQGRLGVHEAKTLVLKSPFRFERQAILYLPLHLPHPHSRGFLEASAEEIRRILGKTDGRALLLFTSRQGLDGTYRLLEGTLPFPLLRQGDQPKGVLLERFRTEIPSVLFGTGTFWQGIDLPGEALSCIIIDKLPFSPPSDPLIEARIESLEEQGINPFDTYQLPLATLTLKQGLGRLIRSRRDRGVLAILDVRLTRKSYGERLLSELPPCPVTHELSDIDRFFATYSGSDLDGPADC